MSVRPGRLAPDLRMQAIGRYVLARQLLPRGVTVAREILDLFVKVRILARQHSSASLAHAA